jgi:glycerophosphoryl diester phosphodiesterase
LPVCSHDPDLKRVHGRSETVEALDAAELERAGVLGLTTVLMAARGRCRAVLDIKVKTKTELEPTLGVLNALGMGAEVVIGVRSLEFVPVIRHFYPDATLLGLVRHPSELAAFYEAGGTIGRLWEAEATRAGIPGARRGGHQVWVTVGGRGGGSTGNIGTSALRRLYEDGADGVLVNDPAQAVAVRDEL